MNWVWSGILLLIAMFCKVEGDFAHKVKANVDERILYLVGIICNILAVLCILL